MTHSPLNISSFDLPKTKSLYSTPKSKSLPSPKKLVSSSSSSTQVLDTLLLNNNNNNINNNSSNGNNGINNNNNNMICKKRNGENLSYYSSNNNNNNNSYHHATFSFDHNHMHNHNHHHNHNHNYHHKNEVTIINNGDVVEDKNLESFPFLAKLKQSIENDSVFRKENGAIYLVEMVKSPELLASNNNNNNNSNSNNNNHTLDKNILIYEKNEHGDKDGTIKITIADKNEDDNDNDDDDDNNNDDENKKLINETRNINNNKQSNAYTYTTTTVTSTTATTVTTGSSYPVSIISRYDRMMSTPIHTLECGILDYIFIPGAFVFGSKFMFVTILFSILLVKISGFLFTGICCAITVSITQFSKKYTQRLRPDPIYIQKKLFDFRTKLTNYSFPSGDTAQAAAYGSSLYLLTNQQIYLILIPICAWSRIYFGCHFVGDCVVGAIIGILVTMFLWAVLPLGGLTLMEYKIVHFILAIITR